MGSEYFWMSGGMWFMPLIGISIILFILFSIFGRNNNSNEVKESAMEILKKRYVKGEISKEEFEQMKKDIK